MSVSFHSYNNIDSFYWKPVDFKPVGNAISLNKIPIVCNTGLKFYAHEMLKNLPDFSFNKRTGFLLTFPVFNTLIFKASELPKDSSELIKIVSPIADSNGFGFTFTLYSTNSSISNPKYGLINSGSKYFSSKNTFEFIFLNNKVSIKDSNGYFLTVSNHDQLIFDQQILINNQVQLFDYFLGKDSICLFQSDTKYQKSVDYSTGTVKLITTNSSLSFLEPTSIFKFTSYKKELPNVDATLPNSFLVKYVTDPTKSQDLLEINDDFTNENPLSQNYLGIFPVEYPTINDYDVTYPLQIHGLKNYQTPEYNYTIANPLISTSPSIRRIYNKIFSGTNQERGYDKVCLGFESNTKELIFDVEKETAFYFPSTSPTTPIDFSGLIQDGATASEYPFTSDRISIYRENYQEKTPGIPQPSDISKQDNVWFISWLSGSTTGKKQWVDRYYNAAYYTLDQTLTAKSMVYNEKLNPNLPFTYDVPSILNLEPGILYKYFRAGKENSQKFIDYLDFDSSNPLGSKVLSITNWLSSSIRDDSSYHNDGLSFFTKTDNFKKTYFIMDGTNHVVFPSRQSLLQNNKLTVSLWLNVKDWKNIYGDQIFGNYYDSGFGLINEGALTAPIFTIINKSSSILYNINYNFTKLSETNLPIHSSNNYKHIIRLPDYNYWIFDSLNMFGYKFNPLNNIVGSLSSNTLSTYLNFIDQIEIDQNQNFYFYDNTKKAYVTTDSSGNYISYVELGTNSGINRIELDSTNTVITIYGTSSVIDNYNNIWEVVGGNLYKNRQVFASVGATQQITCDSQNNIWISHNQDTISKLNTTTGLFEFSKRIGKNISLLVDQCNIQNRFRYLGFVKVPVDSSTTACDKSLVYDDRLIIVDIKDNEIYILDSTGNLLSKLDIRAISSNPKDTLTFVANGDFTGFSYLRKYGGTTKNLSWKFKIAEPNGNNSQLLSLRYSVSGLPTGWHNFSFAFDSTKGIANYYIDSVLVNKVNFTPKEFQLFYDYRSSLLLGAATVRNTSLNDIIGIDDGYKFIGNVADIKMYSKFLTQGELEQIYFSSPFAASRNSLTWNMAVGNRSYIEEIEHWFKMQIPGSKSKYFNVNIHNLNVDDNIKKIVEDAVKSSIIRITPAEASLYKINWM